MFSFNVYEVLRMSMIFSTVGILLVMIGTILSLWSIIRTKGGYVQTVDWYDHQQENFKKDKKKVIVGTILIICGSIFQIIGLFI